MLNKRGAEQLSFEDQADWLKVIGQAAGDRASKANPSPSPYCLGANVVPSYGDLAVSPALPPNLPGPQCSQTESRNGNGGNETLCDKVPFTPFLALFCPRTETWFPHQRRGRRLRFSRQTGKGVCMYPLQDMACDHPHPSWGWNEDRHPPSTS